MLRKQPLLKRQKMKLNSKKNSVQSMDSSTTKTDPNKTLKAKLSTVSINSLNIKEFTAITTKTNIMFTPMLSNTIIPLRRLEQKRKNSPKNSKRRTITPKVLLNGSKVRNQNPITPSNISIKAIINMPPSTTKKFIINTKSMVHTLFIRPIRNNTKSTRKNIMLRSMRATFTK